MDKNELINLLVELYEYMEDRADADSEGSNLEMRLLTQLGDALYGLGMSNFGSVARSSVDPDYKLGGMKLQESKSTNFDLKKFLAENRLTRESK